MIKLALKTSSWIPTQDQWLRAANTISTVERNRIGEFIFRRDAKQSLAGRLMIRSTLADLSSLPPQFFVLEREKSGRPFLVNPPDTLSNFCFNVSHAGDYAVFVGSLTSTVGIDVMKVELRKNTDINTFFSHMNKQFTQKEWRAIRAKPTNHQQLFYFYRHWCLKESFVKGVGTGLKFGLQRIEFTLGDIIEDSCVTTTVCVDGHLESSYQFEEHFVDNHIIAIASTPPSETLSRTKPQCLQFEDLNVNEIPYNDLQYFREFDQKKEVPGR